ncbi:hypothetical protein B0J13DRAFT_544917 [Dactylonectria estremocensis]|uniref:DUF6594 domain-containing protein n=1 Tax=Dactylonectria estremocensis TaxID=1079267 RepID=A0A9P9F721_9HYPO|nr:hypothetical protein B0J13DRAFT_544917 [Dactylonectria estremocensis]
MSGTVDFPPQSDMITGESTVVRRRRPSLPRTRPVSSPNTPSKVYDSLRSRPLDVAQVDCREEDEPSDGAVIPSSLPTSSSSTANSTATSADSEGLANSASTRSTVTAFTVNQKEDGSTFRERREPRRKPPRGTQRPTSLNLSESESSMVPQDPIRFSSHDTGQFKIRRRGPQVSPSVSSSAPSIGPHDAYSERPTESRSDISWSPEFPEYAIASQPPSQVLPAFEPAFDPHFGAQYPLPQPYPIQTYGAPETPRGNRPFPFFSPSQYPNSMAAPNPAPAPNPRFPQPRAERPPLSGYELLAAKLAGEAVGGPPIRPMYRRFEALNHRILLSLQDQIILLEETLREMDEIDSGNRLQGNIPLPASEREERASDHEFHLGKGRVFNQLTEKLQVYYSLISSFRYLNDLPSPTEGEIRDYVAFLEDRRPAAEPETLFLDEEDLILLEPRPFMEQKVRDTQSPRPTRSPGSDQRGPVPPHRQIFHRGPLQEVAIGAVAAIFGPLLAFPVIHDFAGRMTIVVLFATIVCMVLLGFGAFNIMGATNQDAREYLFYGMFYTVVMTALAWLLQ